MLKDTYCEKAFYERPLAAVCLCAVYFRAVRADFLSFLCRFDLGRGDDGYGWHQAALPPHSCQCSRTDKLFLRLRSRKSYAEDKSFGGKQAALPLGSRGDFWTQGSTTRRHVVSRFTRLPPDGENNAGSNQGATDDNQRLEVKRIFHSPRLFLRLSPPTPLSIHDPRHT